MSSNPFLCSDQVCELRSQSFQVWLLWLHEWDANVYFNQQRGWRSGPNRKFPQRPIQFWQHRLLDCLDRWDAVHAHYCPHLHFDAQPFSCFRVGTYYAGYLIPVTTGWFYFQALTTDDYFVMWADIPGGNGGQCAQGALVGTPSASNYITMSQLTTPSPSGPYYMTANVAYAGGPPPFPHQPMQVAATCALTRCRCLVISTKAYSILW